MGRAVNLSPLGLYQWDQTIFDLMQIPSALDKSTLVDNLLAETAELEVLYPNPIVFKNLVGVWSAKQIDIWNRLYATTKYEYNPIENYNRYETGSETGAGSTTHSGTDTTTDTTANSGTDKRTEQISHSGTDSLNKNLQEGGTEGEQTSSSMTEGGTQGESGTGSKTLSGTDRETTSASMTQGGSDVVTGTDTKGRWIAGFDSAPSGQDDGLVKQTRDQDDGTTTTAYGKTETDTGNKSTTYGKTENDTNSNTITFGKTESGTGGKTTTFGKTETETNQTVYGKNENVTETQAYGKQTTQTTEMKHGENISTSNDGSHELHAHGNIGVTTTQKLIREQRDIDLFNLYDIIIEDFKMRFCILIY